MPDAAIPAEIVLVHNYTKFADQIVAALRAAGHQVAVFADPIDALDVGKTGGSPQHMREFPTPESNGVALALMTPLTCPVHRARRNGTAYVGHWGVRRTLVAISDLVTAAERLLVLLGPGGRSGSSPIWTRRRLISLKS